MRSLIFTNISVIIFYSIIIIGTIIGNIFYNKWIWYDEPSHIKHVECTINQCNVTEATCDYINFQAKPENGISGSAGNNIHHEDKYFCYFVSAVCTALIN